MLERTSVSSILDSFKQRIELWIESNSPSAVNNATYATHDKKRQQKAQVSIYFQNMRLENYALQQIFISE